MIVERTILALDSASCVIALFSAALAIGNRRVGVAMGFLALYFAASGLSDLEVILVPIFTGVFSPLQLENLALFLFPIGLVAAPMLWFYVIAISKGVLPQRKTVVLHLLPFLVLLVASTWFLGLPENMQQALLNEQTVRMGMVATVLLGVLHLAEHIGVLIWLAYAVPIVKHVISHNHSLRQYFSNTEEKELGWLSLLATFYLASFTFYYLSNWFSAESASPNWLELISSFLGLVLIVWAAFHGLKQRPSLVPETKQTEPGVKKYQKSALSEADASRIAEKLHAAMQEHKLFREADLSLSVLSNHLGISSNYLSQTLNETLQTSFFEYVNHWRIKEAIPLLANKDRTVLDVAYKVGFNSRSAFYRAYKRETGETPGRGR